MTQREIKFRGISDEISNNGQWVYGGVHFDKESGFVFITLPENKVTETFNMIYPNTLGQFTGLKDSQGKEIYEGDIVKSKTSGQVFPITYDEGAFNAKGWILDKETAKQCEVLGNIFENSDLLPQTK